MTAYQEVIEFIQEQRVSAPTSLSALTLDRLERRYHLPLQSASYAFTATPSVEILHQYNYLLERNGLRGSRKNSLALAQYAPHCLVAMKDKLCMSGAKLVISLPEMRAPLPALELGINFSKILEVKDYAALSIAEIVDLTSIAGFDKTEMQIQFLQFVMDEAKALGAKHLLAVTSRSQRLNIARAAENSGLAFQNYKEYAVMVDELMCIPLMVTL